MVGVIYRPPHSDVSYWRKFENNIQPILDLNIPVILGGDLSIDMLLILMSTLTGQWSLQKLGETLISRTRFGLFVINKSIHVADVWVIRVGSHTTFSKFRHLIYIYVKSRNFTLVKLKSFG
jgi:hypothetical protein